MRSVARVLMALFLINVVIMTHELGHFAVAEAFGFPASVISLGFGPKVYSFPIREGLEGRISAIPLGGYVGFDEKAEELMKPAPYWQGVVLYGAGIAVNWFSPFVVLLVLSGRYRRLDKNRKTFPFLLSGKIPNNFFWKIPILGSTAFMFLCLVRPLGSEGLSEELAWKYTDLARCVGYVNLLPILGLDGSGIYSNLIHSLGIHLGDSSDLIVRIGLVVLIVLTSGTYKMYRKLL